MFEWPELVHRHTPLIRSICHRYELFGADADDVHSTVWLHLVTNLSRIREPAAIAGWLATTTRRECLGQLRRRNRCVLSEPEEITIDEDPAARLLAKERQAALATACAQLPSRDRALLSMLFADPPVPYTKISARMGMPVGAIGPTRQRCLTRLRQTCAIAALLHVDDGVA
jgi:RNA polymerase sigma factor (sigma-70 family)